MNILLTADVLGGVWTYAISLTRALERHGVHVTLATMGGALSAAQREDVRRCRNVQLHSSSFRLEWMHDAWDDVAAAGEWLLELDRAIRPDVVHLNGFSHGALPWSAPVLVVGHSCVLSWWQAVHGVTAPPEWQRYRTAVAAGLHAAAAVAAPTQAMLAALATHYGPLARAHVIANGVGEQLQGANGPGSAAAAEPLVLAAGRAWDESKNFRTLAAASEHIAWPVFLAGSNAGPGGEAQPLRGVNCLGTLSADELRGWYRRAAVLAHPALYEPFGLAPLEAAAEGAALVLGDIPSLREVWADAATYVPPRDAGALAAAINALAAEPVKLRQMADAARQRAALFTAERMASRYRALYDQLRGPGGREVVACTS